MPKNRAVVVSEVPEPVIPETRTQPVNAVTSAITFIGVIFSLKSIAEIIVTKRGEVYSRVAAILIEPAIIAFV